MVANIGQYGNGDDFLQDTLPRLISSFASGALGYAQAMSVLSTSREHDEDAKALAEQRNEHAALFKQQVADKASADTENQSTLSEGETSYVNNPDSGLPAGTTLSRSERLGNLRLKGANSSKSFASADLTGARADELPDYYAALNAMHASQGNLRTAQAGVVQQNANANTTRAAASWTTAQATGALRTAQAGVVQQNANANTTRADATLDNAITNAIRSGNSADNAQVLSKLRAAQGARVTMDKPEFAKLSDEDKANTRQIWLEGMMSAIQAPAPTATPIPVANPSPTPMPQANSAPITSPHSSGPPKVVPPAVTWNMARKLKADDHIQSYKGLSGDPAKQHDMLTQFLALPTNDPARNYILASIGVTP